MKLDLLNASFEPLFSVGIGNLPETYGADGEREGCPLTRYRMPDRVSIRQVISRRTGLKETKAHPRIHTAYYFRKLGIA